ncbi:MAG: hypothetical protein Q7T50_02655 [Candidatus Magasanikbacteria bacterium]|nr:hypothetical protein [Candidatus Magasanikbacteria bacterium]
MKKIKKWLFPFTKTQNKLRKYWWHRVLVVLFFLVVAIAPYQLTMTAYENSFTPLFNCENYSDDDFLARDYNDASVEKWEAEKAECESKYAVSENIFFVFGAVTYVIFFYGLQAIYFLIIVKLVSYIVRGGQEIE